MLAEELRRNISPPPTAENKTSLVDSRSQPLKSSSPSFTELEYEAPTKELRSQTPTSTYTSTTDKETKIPAIGSLPKGSLMPLASNQNFSGREQELLRLAQLLEAGKPTVISQVTTDIGMSGTGKTRLAVEYVYRYGRRYTGGVFWLNFSDTEKISIEIARCGGAKGMNLSDFKNLSLPDQVKRVQAEWQKQTPCLLVFDNAAEPQVVEEWRPKTGNSHVLITSRRSDWRRDMGVQVLILEEGPSLHIATDLWTLNDTLGYRAYARAIYRFMTHQQTKPPLTISVQAPWGGGKTSLMRMIQRELDPEALNEIGQDKSIARGSIKVKDVLNEIDDWVKIETSGELPQLSEQASADEPRRLTVWFNVWKYESTNQIWAGLADAIVRQVAARLSPIERERFWLRLHLKRVDADKIRHQVYERIFRYWWRKVFPWLWGSIGLLLVSALTALVGYAMRLTVAQHTGWALAAVSVLGSLFQFLKKFQTAKKTVEDEPASISLNEYLTVPDYNAELGFIHHVESDLRRVFASIPQQHRPLVVFIDDLDRCSPAKVAEVVEAINLFIAGDFPDCMFVLGMDAEMVAAALEAAHSEVISRLPVDAATPVGWRFMDKFVQLPFVIPPAEKSELERYTEALFSVDGKYANETIAVKGEKFEKQTTSQQSEASGTSSAQAPAETKIWETTRQKIDTGVENFTDENPEIRRLICEAAATFSRNPRELKRFVNAFRFQYFLWWARRARNFDEELTLEQLQRWVVLSMKWPEVVRWLRRSGGRERRIALDEKAATTVPSRLKLLEEMGSKTPDLNAWCQQALDTLRLASETTSWLNDDDLRQFFCDECTKYPSGQRLSDGAGKGLW